MLSSSFVVIILFNDMICMICEQKMLAFLLPYLFTPSYWLHVKKFDSFLLVYRWILSLYSDTHQTSIAKSSPMSKKHHCYMFVDHIHWKKLDWWQKKLYTNRNKTDNCWISRQKFGYITLAWHTFIGRQTAKNLSTVTSRTSQTVVVCAVDANAHACGST